MKGAMLRCLICRVESNENGISFKRKESHNRFIDGHSRSVTFVGIDKLNKILVSAGSDGVVLVHPFQNSS